MKYIKKVKFKKFLKCFFFTQHSRATLLTQSVFYIIPIDQMKYLSSVSMTLHISYKRLKWKHALTLLDVLLFMAWIISSKVYY